MKPNDALQAVRQIMAGPRSFEADRLQKISDALKPDCLAPTVEMPKDPLPVMTNLAKKSRTNLLPLVLDTFSQTIKADGHSNPAQWSYWQENQMDARQTGLYRSAMQNGASYATGLRGDRSPVIEGISARNMTAVYQNPTRDEWPMMALHVDGSLLKLYDEASIYYFGVESGPRSGLVADPVTTGMYPSSAFKYIETRSHGLSICPVVRYRDRMLLDGEEQFGIIEPLITIQQRIDETVFGLMIAQYYSAFLQKYIVGWVPNSEREALEASASALWTFADKDVKPGTLAASDLTRYISSKDAAFRDMAAIAQIPVQALGTDGVSNISDAALSGLGDGKERKSDEMRTSFGESHEQLLRLCSLIDGDTAAADDYTSEIRWKNTTARSLAVTVDALVKMVTSLGVPESIARQWIPDWTDQLEADAQRLGPSVATSDPLQQFLDSVQRQSRPSAPPNVVAG